LGHIDPNGTEAVIPTTGFGAGMAGSGSASTVGGLIAGGAAVAGAGLAGYRLGTLLYPHIADPLGGMLDACFVRTKEVCPLVEQQGKACIYNCPIKGRRVVFKGIDIPGDKWSQCPAALSL